MRQSGKCPKCGSQDIFQNARVLDKTRGLTDSLEIAVYDKPEALIFNGEKRYSMGAWVCKGCGYTELYCL